LLGARKTVLQQGGDQWRAFQQRHRAAQACQDQTIAPQTCGRIEDAQMFVTMQSAGACQWLSATAVNAAAYVGATQVGSNWTKPIVSKGTQL
jgi:hypothetical protein